MKQKIPKAIREQVWLTNFGQVYSKNVILNGVKII